MSERKLPRMVMEPERVKLDSLVHLGRRIIEIEKILPWSPDVYAIGERYEPLFVNRVVRDSVACAWVDAAVRDARCDGAPADAWRSLLAHDSRTDQASFQALATRLGAIESQKKLQRSGKAENNQLASLGTIEDGTNRKDDSVTGSRALLTVPSEIDEHSVCWEVSAAGVVAAATSICMLSFGGGIDGDRNLFVGHQFAELRFQFRQWRIFRGAIAGKELSSLWGDLQSVSELRFVLSSTTASVLELMLDETLSRVEEMQLCQRSLVRADSSSFLDADILECDRLPVPQIWMPEVAELESFCCGVREAMHGLQLQR